MRVVRPGFPPLCSALVNMFSIGNGQKLLSETEALLTTYFIKSNSVIQCNSVV